MAKKANTLPSWFELKSGAWKIDPAMRNRSPAHRGVKEGAADGHEEDDGAHPAQHAIGEAPRARAGTDVRDHDEHRQRGHATQQRERRLGGIEGEHRAERARGVGAEQRGGAQHAIGAVGGEGAPERVRQGEKRERGGGGGDEEGQREEGDAQRSAALETIDSEQAERRERDGADEGVRPGANAAEPERGDEQGCQRTEQRDLRQRAAVDITQHRGPWAFE